MTNYIRNIFFAVLISIFLTSCDLIGGIFEAGVWVGVIVVLVIAGLIFFLIKKLF